MFPVDLVLGFHSMACADVEDREWPLPCATAREWQNHRVRPSLVLIIIVCMIPLTLVHGSIADFIGQIGPTY